MSFTVVTPVLASFASYETPVTKTETVDQQRSQEFIYNSKLTKEERKRYKELKKEMKKEKKNNGIIFGLGILGVILVVLLCIWIF